MSRKSSLPMARLIIHSEEALLRFSLRANTSNTKIFKMSPDTAMMEKIAVSRGGALQADSGVNDVVTVGK